MAETIISTIAEEVLRKLTSFIAQEVGLAKGVKNEIKKLQNTMSAIKAVLLDAEQQQAENHSVRDWLEKLKDAVYDVDDVLDEVSTEALRRKVEIHGSMRKEVLNFFSSSNPLAFRSEIGHKIKDIREKLDNIAVDRRNFQFNNQVVDVHAESRVRVQTHSFVQESDVIGRVEDKERIVHLLLTSGDDKGLSVIPIVGLGGLGKTTLAKLVYKDDRVVQDFDLRMWVCVTEDFDLKKLIEKIIESGSGVGRGYTQLDSLQRCLQDNLNGKKYLLVLDDVWNEDPTKWMELRNLLLGGATGSKIVVTTRSIKVASIMGTIAPYRLGFLSNDECLSIFVKCAFKEGHEKEHPKLLEIGKEIVTKCGGIPLAVRTLGCLLCMETKESEWISVKDNDIWKLEQTENGILPALRLSYQQLPSHLKQCFAYCSVYPKDFRLVKFNLINQWLAQGFLQSANEGQQLEEIGNRYFNELLSRSFFQDVVETFDGDIYECKMHDLMHDLARLVVGVEVVNVDFNSIMVSKRARHALFFEYNLLGEEFPACLLNAKKLRSFSFAYSLQSTNKSFVDALIFHFRCLRVLDLSNSKLEELPSYVGKLKHLRHLDLSFNPSLKELPNSICKLLNLQTLDLYGCEELQDLPRNIGKLISLRYFCLTSQLICLPEKGLQGLTSIRHLSLYQCNRLTSLSEEIQHLGLLQSLYIDRCSSLTSLPSGMKHLAALEDLSVLNCEKPDLLEGEYFQGMRSLRTLSMVGLPNLVALPQGLQRSAATLQNLDIRNCPRLTKLPEWLQALASLQILYIWNCPNLLSLPEGMSCLTALKRLSVRGCPHLSRSCAKDVGEDWPKISHIPKIRLDGEYLGQ